MQTLTEACGEIVARSGRGLDTVVEGDAGAVRTLLQQATLRLQESHGVVTVVGPAGGLSLSGLIAQLSGRGNLDDHDDAVLELGVRRLTEATEPGRKTVLVLDAPFGVHRSAFRFLRQVGRQAPELIYVVAAFPEMAASLAEPGMEALQERFAAAAVVASSVPETAIADGTEREPAAVPPTVVIPLEWQDLRAAPLSARDQARTPRRMLLWTASAVGVAASVTIGAWLGTQTGQRASIAQVYEAVPAPGRRTIAMASVAAEVGAPSLAATTSPPVAGSVATPDLPPLPRADLADSTRPELATAAAPGMASATTAMALATPGGRAAGDDGAGETLPLAGLPRDSSGTQAPSGRGRPPARASRVASSDEHRRVLSPRPQRLATLPLEPMQEDQAPARWPQDEAASRQQPTYPGESEDTDVPPVRYRRYSAPTQEWRGERAVAPADGPYIGTYEPGPYGARVFRYEP